MAISGITMTKIIAKIVIGSKFHTALNTFNACRMKTRPDGFWRPTNQNFVFRPSIFLLKNNEF